MANRALKLGIAALLVVGVTRPLAPQSTGADQPTMAVSDFEGFLLGEAGNSGPVGKAVSSMLITELSGRPGLKVIERYRLQELLTEQKLSLSGRVDAATASQVGKMIGAQYLVFGQVSGVASSMRMDVRLVDAETGEILEVQKLTDKPTELLSMVEKLADLFMANLKLTPPSARPKAESIPVNATIEFSRGVDFQDKGDTARAIEHYRKALEIYPNFLEAKKALDALEKKGGDDR
ncbi:MAG: hypothetical protein HY704_06960 [Gemmatimonadetes bacterium]|nr:hypothetical protein [Gemmatimonadota bacterium]